MRSYLSIALLFIPLTAGAQSYDNSPLIIVNEKHKPAAVAEPAASKPIITPASAQHFPAAAITRVGEVTGGTQVETPVTPASPANPANPAAATPAATPASPASPANPVSKLWPKDTVPIFMTSCVGFSPVKIKPCSCVITQLMTTMGHDEFLAKSENNTIEQEPRLQQIRLNCATAPQKKD
jgi:hypothetical protein